MVVGAFFRLKVKLPRREAGGIWRVSRSLPEWSSGWAGFGEIRQAFKNRIYLS